MAGRGRWRVEFFMTAAGRCPVQEYIDRLSSRESGRLTLQHRVLYFVAPGRRLILLHAFTKKTSRTPRTELETARRRMSELGRWAD
jgi:phage-related protein